MIRSESEYREALARHRAEKKRLSEHRKRLEEAGLRGQELKRALDPLRSFQTRSP